MSTLVHAASRDALAATELQLLQATDGAQPAEITGIADELFGVADLLSSESTLRRALADAATEQGSREELARGLFAQRISARTLPVVVEAVRARWSGPRDLVAGIEQMARTALLVQAERVGRLDAVEDELFRLGRIVGADVELDRLLSDPTANVHGKVTVAEQLIDDKVEEITRSLVRQLVAQSHGRRVSEGLADLAEMSAKRRERSVAHVRSAMPLDEEQRQRLTRTLQRVYARPITLHLEIDPELRGGLVIRVGDEVIDGSIAGRLQSLRRELAE